MRGRGRMLLALGIAITLVGVACDDDGDDVSSKEKTDTTARDAEHEERPECEVVGDASKATSRVSVLLSEFIVTPEPAEVAAGTVTLAADNKGGDAHELVVVKAADAASLPKADDGSVDEDALPEGAFIGEIEPFPSKTTCEGTFTLGVGSYVLFCNIVEEEEDGTIENHFTNGMVATLAVT